MSSNLPPGCTSDDGGINHEFESASEALLDALETAEECQMLRDLLLHLRGIMRDHWDDGYAAGRHDMACEINRADEVE